MTFTEKGIRTKKLSEVKTYFNREGMELFGEQGFGVEVVNALKNIGAFAGDDIEIYDEWDDENGAGTINGRTFYEDANWGQLRFAWEF